MEYIKRGDLIQSIAKVTGLSAQNSKKVAKSLIADVTARPGRPLTKDQEKKAIKALPKALKDLKMKVKGGGLNDERRFRQKFTKTVNEFKQGINKNGKNGQKPLKSGVDFLEKVRQGVPGSKESESKRSEVAVSGNALGRQTQTKDVTRPLGAPRVRAERVSLADNSANIETMGRNRQSNEPIAPNIG